VLTEVEKFVRPNPEEIDMLMKLSCTLAAAALSFAFAGKAFADPADDIIAKNKCHSCHTATTTKKAPSWASVAEKHKGDAGAEAKLVEFLKTGGAEDHKKVAGSDAEIKAVVAKVLASK
jgi:cytochrome c